MLCGLESGAGDESFECELDSADRNLEESKPGEAAGNNFGESGFKKIMSWQIREWKA